MLLRNTVIVVLCLILTASTAPGHAQDTSNAASFGEINGTVSYLLRIALPPDAVVSVLLDDVTPGAKPTALVGAVSLPTKGKQVPIPFRLSYFKGDLVEGRKYAFNVTITAKSGLLFLGSAHYTVPASGATDPDVKIIVEQFVQATPLIGTQWKLTELNGKPVPAAEDKRGASLIFQRDGKVTGSGGINRLMASYARKGATLKFKPAAMTMMAGPPEQMERERAFAAALAATNNYRITGKTLELRKDAQVLARFAVGQKPYP